MILEELRGLAIPKRNACSRPGERPWVTSRIMCTGWINRAIELVAGR